MKKWALLLILCMLAAAASAEPAEWIDISTPEELADIAENPSGNYRLTGDIDMTGVDWLPVSLNGRLDGNGWAILNLNVTCPGLTRFSSRDGNELVYDTVGAGLFDCCNGAQIRNLKLLGVNVDVTTDENCFCGTLMGGGEGVKVENCTVDGRVTLKQTAQMCGVSGLIGYARCAVANTKVRADVVLVDENRDQNCEEFGSGLLACGFADADSCEIAVDLYASVHGYCHNGGLIGMQLRHGAQHRRSLINNDVRFRITFFEDVKSRRAYADAFVGERLGESISMHGNVKTYFKVRETKDYSKELYPCTCSSEPVRTVIAPTTQDYGYTENCCPDCGYTYNSDFVSRLTGVQ